VNHISRRITLQDIVSFLNVKLSPRTRQVLNALIDGDSEKQIAIRLNISEHTVHTYAKRIHRAFDVNSRGELLAKVIRALAAALSPTKSLFATDVATPTLHRPPESPEKGPPLPSHPAAFSCAEL